MDTSVIEIIGTALGSSGITTLITGWYNRRQTAASADKTSAEAKTDLAGSTLKWAEVLTHRIDVLEGKLDTMQRENVSLQISIAGVQTELRLYKEGRINMVPLVPSVPSAVPPLTQAAT